MAVLQVRLRPLRSGLEFLISDPAKPDLDGPTFAVPANMPVSVDLGRYWTAHIEAQRQPVPGGEFRDGRVEGVATLNPKGEAFDKVLELLRSEDVSAIRQRIEAELREHLVPEIHRSIGTDKVNVTHEVEASVP